MARRERLFVGFVEEISFLLRWNHEACALVVDAAVPVTRRRDRGALASRECIAALGEEWPPHPHHIARDEQSVVDARKACLVSDNPIATVARLRDNCSGQRVVRQDGNVGAVGVATPVPVEDVFARRGINLEASDISLNVVIALC